MSRRFSDACERNREPIADVLRSILPETGRVIEVGAGTGQHAVHFARTFPGIAWQPVDRPEWLDSIRAWRTAEGTENLHEPMLFDLFDDHPPSTEADAVVAINVLHIAPEPAIIQLFRHASEMLKPGGIVYVYGPFRYVNRALELFNTDFDRWLRTRDPASGVRDVEQVDAEATRHGFVLDGDVAMPANNRSRWWRFRGHYRG